LAEPIILTELDARGVASVTLNRVEVHNAYNGELIDTLSAALQELAADAHVRVLVLRANGKHFQAGADINWLKSTAAFDQAQNLDFSKRTVDAIRTLDAFPCPSIALVHGACYGGGVGMVAACDIALASENAVFALTEVRIGVLPAPIAPQLAAAIGPRAFRRYGLSGERFDAAEARRIGIVHEVCSDGALDEAAAPILEALLLGGPRALAASKQLIAEIAGTETDDALAERLTSLAAETRVSEEAREGLSAFLEKRQPAWYRD
jgi:methylglutaconyl-CoA hydratase